MSIFASTGNINPTRICNSYQQSPFVATLNDIILTTPINTDLDLRPDTFLSNLTPIIPGGLNSICVQNLPNYGSLYENSNLLPQAGIYNFNYGYVMNLSDSKYTPPTGFKGVACFDVYFTDYTVTQLDRKSVV